MLILKKTIAFLFILAMLSTLGGFIFYIIYNNLFHNKYGPNRYFEDVKGVFLALVFIYLLNLFLYQLWLLAKKKTVISRSLSAFLLTFLVWIVLGTFTWGIDLKGTLIVVVSVGIPAFILNFITEKILLILS